MNKIIALLVILFINNALNAQLALSDFNSAGMNGWQMINDTNSPDASYWSPFYAALWQNQAFIKEEMAPGDSALIAPAIFDPLAAPDRWLISPLFTVENNSNSFLLFDYLGNDDPPISEEFEILVSPSGSADVDSFISLSLLTVGSDPKTLSANIGTLYKGQTIRVAIRYISSDGSLAIIDNIRSQILLSVNAKLDAIKPALNSLEVYGTIGTSIIVTGSVTNLGAATIPSYTVYYKEENKPTISQTVSPPSLSTYSKDAFTFSVPIMINALGPKNIKVWISAAGDMNFSNDTLNTTLIGVSFMPRKKLLFEQATGTWCGWCPRGHVFMDSFAEKPQNGTTIAVHNSDPMTDSLYDDGINKLPIFDDSYPGLVIDRKLVVDPRYIFSEYNVAKDYFGFADMKRSIPTVVGSTLTTKVTVRPAINLNGNYRLALVISEDKITGYSQVNYYSSSSFDIDLVYKGENWRDKPNPVPAGGGVVFNHVARGIFPAFNGGASSALPASMIAGEDYTINITANLGSSWKLANLKYSILLIDASSGHILNTINDTGYLAPKSVVTSGLADTFFSKITDVNTLATSTVDVYSNALNLPVGVNYTWIVKKANIVLPTGLGWKFLTICDPRNCYNYTDDKSDTFNARPSNNKIYLGFDHNKSAGYGYAILDLWKTSEGESKKLSYKYSLLTTASSAISLVSSVHDKLLYYFDHALFIDHDFMGAQLEIYDNVGKLVSSAPVIDNIVPFKPSASGMYIARLVKHGEVLKLHKFIISK